MIKATHGEPDVFCIAFPTGGYNYHAYAAYLSPALEWAHLPAPS